MPVALAADHAGFELKHRIEASYRMRARKESRVESDKAEFERINFKKLVPGASAR
jgi:ribose 5-phosphate isomerase RpiB